ncbi:MAG: N-acetylmuramoyl-L-alanine amidase family protein, partial [Catonella sp.]|uniref:N-acetylmuramoyl-L-alanine amidase family protein n=1 Tax=Catonella sp. TaxID=2382125 RepID=UPI003FA106E8
TPIDFNKVRGTEIHYNEKIKNTKVSSERFATLILDNICSVIDTKKRGAVRGSELYVLGHTNMPSALVEIGFLTNKEDLALIQDDKKMKQCAEAAYEAIVQAFKENEE